MLRSKILKLKYLILAVTRDEVIYVQAKSSNRETRTIPTNLN